MSERVERLAIEGSWQRSSRCWCSSHDTLGAAAALIALVKRGPWRTADADTRFEVLALIDAAIVTLRERAGLPPIDDTLPWTDEPLTVFQVIREMLR